jgi:IclR family transcriptional regulator, KDG regulon repressor
MKADKNTDSTDNTIRAVDRALDVLLCFSTQTPALTMTQISEKTGIHKSTVHRLLATLEQRHFVRREVETGIYRPGVQLIQVAQLALEGMNIHQIALPYMQILAEEFRETVDLAVLDQNHVMFLDVIQSPQRVKLSSAPGMRLPAFATASGKAILAWLPQEEALQIRNDNNLNYEINKMPTIEAYLEDLRQTRERGYSLDEEDLEIGIKAVGSPIIGKNGDPIASIAVAGPAFRLDHALLVRIGKRLVEITNEISNRMLLTNEGYIID